MRVHFNDVTTDLWVNDAETFNSRYCLCIQALQANTSVVIIFINLMLF